MTIGKARCNLLVTLLVGIDGLKEEQRPDFEELVRQELPVMRFAGGHIIPDKNQLRRVRTYTLDDEDESDATKYRLRSMLMPGYALVGRDVLMEREEGKDALDTMLQSIMIKKDHDGWNVPMIIGYKALSDNIKVKGQRDYDKEHYFVEPVCSIGEFVIPYRFTDLEDMMWRYKYIPEEGLYICENKFGGSYNG
jgi:CRISPR-associated protein Csy2